MIDRDMFRPYNFSYVLFKCLRSRKKLQTKLRLVSELRNVIDAQKSATKVVQILRIDASLNVFLPTCRLRMSVIVDSFVHRFRDRYRDYAVAYVLDSAFTFLLLNLSNAEKYLYTFK